MGDRRSLYELMEKRTTGRIVRSLSGFYDVQTSQGVITCRGRGSLRKNHQSPLTGDMVEITVEKGRGMVEHMLPRKNSFVRPAVANIDALVIFAANVNPVTEPFLIDRVAAIAGDQEVPVYICVNKCDLDPAIDLVRIYEHAGFPVIRASAETGEGVEELRQLIRGKLTAFTGNSGVGKSSMLNRLCPQLALPTGEVSEKLGRGRHTTRHVELYCLEEDTFVADTPGFSSFDTDQMELILKENLQYAFPDFGAYIGACQFHDCSHRAEPGCAVTAAVASGDVERSRYDSYLRLYEKSSQIKLWERK
jgi:ribosome biogenesis GTPase